MSDFWVSGDVVKAIIKDNAVPDSTKHKIQQHVFISTNKILRPLI